MDELMILKEDDKDKESITSLQDPSNVYNNCKITTFELENIKIEMKDLHRSINIKENEPILEYQQETSSSPFQIKTEGKEYKLEGLHHSIDIKEDPSILECNTNEECELELSDKPFMCKVCDYKCAHKTTLKIHLRSHTGEKPFNCKICNKNFLRHCTLKRHLRTHTGEKPFMCEVCNYKCSQKTSLKRHLRTHTGEKPFTCEICDHKCALKENLKKHLRTHTG